MISSVGSVCSGIEAASVPWEPLGLSFTWFSEIASFPSLLLSKRYPSIPNLGDMTFIAPKLLREEISSPDLICGGTPCQAFSLAGWKNGLNDDRGNLTLRFVDIIEANDQVRKRLKKSPTVVFWENVEGVLTDKTNAFGCMISSLAGLDNIIVMKKWPQSGLLRGPKRNVAWRVLDAKYFGLPQQRRRLYLVAGGKDFSPERVLFEKHDNVIKDSIPSEPLLFEKEGHHFEVFRTYTDCLYSAYGTKWNGNAAAYNGSLFVVQDERIRRLSPLECERLMGFPDDYTNINGAKKTLRYQATGNSWAVPVVHWIGKRLSYGNHPPISFACCILSKETQKLLPHGSELYCFSKDVIALDRDFFLNCTSIPENCSFATMKDIVSPTDQEDIYLSPVGCQGIVRRKQERNLKINARLEEVLLRIASTMTEEEIERRSRVQRRGRIGAGAEKRLNSSKRAPKKRRKDLQQLSLLP